MFDNKNTRHYLNILSFGWKKIVGLSLLAIFISTVLAGIIQTPTHAASLEMPTKNDEKVQKLLLTRFLGYCIKNAPLSGGILIDNGARITGNATANKGDWFLTSQATIGPYMTDDRFSLWSGADDGGYIRPVGYGDCGDEKTIALAIKAIGAKNGVEALCKSGFVRSDGSDGGTFEGCVAGNGDFKHKNGAKTGSNESYNAFAKAYPEPSLNDQDWYWFYRKTFNWSCGYGKMTTSVSKDVAEGNKNFGYSLTYVTDSPDYKETKYFIGLEKRDVNISTRLGTGGSDTAVNRTCAQIEGHIKEYGDKYATYLATLAANGGLQGELSQETAGSSDDGGGGTTSKSSCAIDGIGWIICPVVNFLANIADASFNFIADTFLRTDVKLLDTSGPTYAAWMIMRNLANVAFVIIFMFIIFSQLTSMGVSNYGVKKMLPRLVVAAILVNVSFILCQLAVDLSNILGYSIDGAIAGVSNSIPINGGRVDPLASGTSFSDTAIAILAIAGGVAVLYAMLSVFIPVILAAVIALVMILFLLVARQALIVILIVIAPLAFVAFLLPNTERLFTQWRKMFIALLLLFPIIALVFGLSKLASTLLTGSFSSDFGGDEAANSMWGQIIGAAVLILPLFVVPILLRKSLDGVPMLGQLANKWSGRANSKLGGAVKDSYKGSIVGRGNAIRKQARENYRGRRFAERVSQTGPVGAVNRMFAKNLTPILPADRYANKALVRTAGEAANEALNKDVVAAGRSMEGKIDQGAARTIALGGTAKSIDGKVSFKGGDVATRMAGIDKVVASNDIEGMNQLWEASQTWQGQEGAQLRSHLANRIQASSSKPAYFGAGALEMLRTNQHADPSKNLQTAGQLMTTAVAADAYSPDKIAGADKDELAAVMYANEDRAAADPAYAVSHGSKLQSAAATALSDAQLNRVINKNRNNVTFIAGNPGGAVGTRPNRLT